MSTQSWSTRIRHDSDAVYQEWRDELITKLNLLVAAGVLAADETNITPGVGARPGVNSEQGYAVYHLSDSLHGTAPVYLRFGFGTDNGVSVPRITVGTGTATNGSGTLSGVGNGGNFKITGANTAQTTDTARQSYMCGNAGFFGLSWKTASGAAEGTFIFCRTCDSSGAITAEGGFTHNGDSSSSGFTRRVAVRYAATAVAYAARTSAVSGMLGFSPQAPTNSLVGSDNQVFMAWSIVPRATPLFGICGVINGEVAIGNTFQATLVGSTPRTYIRIGSGCGPFSAESSAFSDGYLCISFLWE